MYGAYAYCGARGPAEGFLCVFATQCFRARTLQLSSACASPYTPVAMPPVTEDKEYHEHQLLALRANKLPKCHKRTPAS